MPNCDLQALLETATVLKIRGLANEKPKDKTPAAPPKKRARAMSGACAVNNACAPVTNSVRTHEAQQLHRSALKRSPEPLHHTTSGKKSPLAPLDHNTPQPLELTRNHSSVLYHKRLGIIESKSPGTAGRAYLF